MSNIIINHVFNEYSDTKIEEEKIKWFVDILIDRYSLEIVKNSIECINKKIKKEAYEKVS